METVLLGLMAGAVTTVAGLGGGTLLLLGLTLLSDPLSALVVTAPALLLGNLHRLWMYRREVRWSISGRFIAGSIPGSLMGGLVATRLPPELLKWMMAGAVSLALLRAAGWGPRRSLGRALTPAGLLIGGLQATCGGAGPVIGGLLKAERLEGVSYVATMASIAVSLHAARLTAYGLGGAVEPQQLSSGLILAAAIAGGNLLGDRVRRAIGVTHQRRSQQLALAATGAMALLALGS